MIKKPSAPKIKPLKQAHTSDSRKGMGDYYGTGVKANMAKVKEGMGFREISKKKMKTPPKSLA